MKAYKKRRLYSKIKGNQLSLVLHHLIFFTDLEYEFQKEYNDILL